MSTERSRLSLLLVLATVLLLSGVSRWAQGRTVRVGVSENWFTTDPDSLYHMRRMDRFLTEAGPVAASDGYLNYPEGSAIPWPPYYTYVAAAFVAPFAPEERGERRAFVEERIASLAFLFGLLATLAAAMAGWRLGGAPGALVAGGYQGLCHLAIVYSKLGNGDHHSFVSFLSGTLLLLVTLALGGEGLRRRGTALAWGAGTGALVGLLLGSWVGGMVTVVQLQLVLGWLILRQGQEQRAGLATYGLALHLTAALVLAPAVFASPWTEVQPWMLINLSWFHLAFLLVGGAVFVPLFWLGLEGKALRRYPWFVAGVLALLGLALFTLDLEGARSIREGFDWASKTDSFMASIRESHSLFAADADPGASEALGLGLWLLPFAWAAAAWACFRRGEAELLPWVVCVPLAFWQALQQARFAEALVLPMAVVLGWGAARLHERVATQGTLKKLPAAGATLALLFVVLAHGSTSLESWKRLSAERDTVHEKPSTLAVREASRWIERNSPSPADYCVLSGWSHGHVIEWAADRPTVATNFGSYVGEGSFRDPSRFFMEEDPAAAEALLERRQARYVLVTSELPDHLNSMIARAAPESRARWVDPAQEGRVLPAWFRTLGARLMFEGGVFMDDAVPSLDFLRLVYVSPIKDPARKLRHAQDVSPAAWVWEYVPGARIEAYSKPGSELRVWLDVEFPRAGRLLKWRGVGVADANGRAVVRVPYATTAPTSEARVRRAGWRLGMFDGELRIDEQAVQTGRTLLVHGSPP